MTIQRVWHGYTTLENADTYQHRLLTEIIPGIEAMGLPGYQGIEVLRRIPGDPGSSQDESRDEVEFITVMTFDSLEGLIAFRGEDYARSHVPASAREVLTRWDAFASHYDVVKP